MTIPLPFMLVIMLALFFISKISSETYTLTQFQSLPSGTRTTLVSKDGTFELGFFSPGSSTNRYLGIWFKNIPLKTVVWVANRDNPINSNTTKLTITKEGNLALLTENDTVHWSTNARAKAINVNVVAQLLDSGNLVLRDEKDNYSQNLLWQSFDHPSDTLLPGMKLGWEVTKDVNLNRYLTAWNNWEDPSSSLFTYGFSLSNIPETQILNGSSMLYRSGPYNGVRLSAVPSLRHRPMFNYDYDCDMTDTNECYYQFKPWNNSLISRMTLNQTVYALQQLFWVETTQEWNLSSTIPRDDCDNYKRCGAFGICAVMDNSKSPSCECLSGFEPKSPQNWVAGNWSEGCVRSSKRWRCRETNSDGFVVLRNVKVPDTRTCWINRSMTLEECKVKCWENCSCTAYANSAIVGKGSGCILWFGDLLDMKQLPDTAQDLYVRLDISQMANREAKVSSAKMVIMVTSIISSVITMLVILAFIYRRRKAKDIVKTKVERNDSNQEDLELPLYDFDTIACSTNDFSRDNKLGQGGFGPVYKGTLPNGRDIAVKRLSQSSTQGLIEFKNEVIFCSKLQHRNLVKVLGCCIEEQEKLLIYEYMSNKSLDFFLFDYSQSKLLDWSKRFNIINGIARGLLYLHQDSRLRIIHRDLKASNILLDDDMNPKISDFGLARMCGGDQIEGSTSRVVGTHGYMAPEYAIDGVFSIKSDVYSFGVLLLEVLSGKKNKGLSYPDRSYNLIGHAWSLWKESIPMEFIDSCLGDSYVVSEAIRCIHIGLLCVQYQSDDRPNMTSIMTMLTSESALPQPKEPLFLNKMVSLEEDFGQNMHYSTNEVTISKLEPR
ncbi:G-type lectin S-receptor-like serine/threonine-protein kinase At4g27290 isoform X1 [Cajanus cajan]|uniref:G-type lectin S-receptor-like serine/threonine-protein kinase At4g27290 isoform X1 n=1 Tax=Cajanus cajan TaxID=3821 RepID=UPI00098DA3FE|nr:G-type lectin S-receptor-like serine/threonine-protein kinase At4g27290 isoform X1 [Cajanus cajan]